MAKITLDDFFDFDNNSINEKFSTTTNLLKNDYTEAIKSLSQEKKVLIKAFKDETKALHELEYALKTHNFLTKEGQEAIAKDAANVSKRISSLKQIKSEQEKVNKEQLQTIEKVKEISKVTQESVKAYKAAAGSIDELRQKSSAAKKQLESMGKDIDPFIKSRALENYTKYKQQLDDANKSIRETVKGNTLAEGSYNALQKEVNELFKEYKNLPDALGKNKVQAEALRKTLFDKRKVLKDLDADMNLHNRNVGNYGETLKEAALSTNLFGGRIAHVATGLEGLRAGLNTAKVGFSGLKVAIASTGIGAILIAFGLLVNLFTKFDAFGDIVSQSFAGIGAAIDVVSRYLAEFTVGIGKAFSNPRKLFEDFGNAIKDFVLERIELLISGVKGLGATLNLLFKGEFKKAAEEAGKSFLEINRAINPIAIGIEKAGDAAKYFGGQMSKASKEIWEAAKAAAELTARMQDLEDAERVFGVTTVRNRGLVEQLILSSRERTLSEAERLKNLKEAGRIETEETEKALKLAKERLDIIISENALKTKLTKDQIANLTLVDGYISELEEKHGGLALGSISGEDLDKQAAAQAELLRIQSDSLRKQQDIKNRESTLILQLQKERDDAIKKEFEAFQKRNEQIIKNGELESRSRRTPAININLEDEALRWENLYKRQLSALKKSRHEGEITEQEYNERVAQIEVNQLQTRLDLLIQFGAKQGDILDAEIALFDAKERQKTEITREQEEVRQQLRQQARDLIKDAENVAFEVEKERLQEKLNNIQTEKAAAIEAAGDNAKQKEIITKEYDKKERKIKRDIAIADREKALFDIGINTAVAVAEASPNVPLIIFAGFLGLAQAALVLAKPLPKYAKGTSHADEGFAIVDEQGPEIIESRGKMFLGENKGPRLTYLRQGDKVRTADETQRILDTNFSDQVLNSYQEGHSKLSKITIGASIDYDKLASKLNPGFASVASAVQNKPSAQINIDKSGFSYFMKVGNMTIEDLKGKYKINL